MITSDGTDDEKIAPEGLFGYKVPSPALMIDPPSHPVEQDIPAASMDQIDPEDEDFDEQPPEEPEDERIDCETDRIFDHEHVGKTVKALYENRWHIGVVRYYNSHLSELKIDFPDGSSDYIKPGEIGDSEIFLFRFV